MKDIYFIESPFDPAELSYCVCSTPKKYKQVLKKLGIAKESRPDFLVAGSDATVHYFDNNNRTICVLCISPCSNKLQRIGLLVHECVHIWQQIASKIREDFPSQEFEAYCIQAIFQECLNVLEQEEKE